MAAQKMQEWWSSLPASQQPVAVALGTGALALLGVTGYLLLNKKKPVEYPVSLDHQSVEIEPGVRAHVLSPDGNLGDYAFRDVKTLHDAFKRGLQVSENGRCLGVLSGSNYKWVSYREVYDRAQRMGSALLKQGIQPNEDGIVGIFASNCVDWVVTEQACSMFSMVVVPLYDTLGAEAVTFVINQTSMGLVVCDTADKVKVLLKTIENTKSLKTIVLLGEVPSELQAEVEEHGLTIISMNDMQDLGQKNLHDPILPSEDDMCTVCFTSGTTGNPKGVMLSHKNLVANVAAVVASTGVELTPGKVHLSYLPLAHVFERLVHIIAFMTGCRIAFLSGSVRNLLKDFQNVRPSVFIAVPRVLNRVYDKVMQGAAESRIKSFLLHFALNRKKAMLRRGEITRDTIWDKLVFSKIQNMMGGNVELFMTGSAPLSNEVLDFTRCVFGCQVFEGYGQTESAGAATVTLPNETEGGHVGPPLVGSLVKLIDVPEMDYFVKDNKGEVCVKGPSVMKGYYKDEEKTREAFDKDGFLLTGDVGQWLPNGTLKIIDRRKHIFKLAQGEYVAPEKIEGVYMQSSMAAQVFVDGQSLETFTVGIIVPDREIVEPWAKKRGLDSDFQDLCQNSELKEAILKDITEIGKKAGLKSFEQVKDIYVSSELFTLDNGLLTPTFKSKRPALRRHFQEVMNEMYAKAKS